MENQPSTTYHFHGHNARVNNNSVDSSTNTVSLNENQLFLELQKAIETIRDESARNRLKSEIENLQSQPDKQSKSNAYLKLMQHAADHVTVLAPFFPAIAHWIGMSH